MTFRTVLTFILLSLYSISFGQNNKLDSLKNLIDQYQDNDTNKIHALIDYAAETYHDEALNGKPYIEKAIHLSKKIGYTRGLGFSKVGMSGYFYVKAQLDSALIYALRGVEILDSIGDKRHILAGYNNIAMIYNNQGKSELAIETYKKIYSKIENDDLSIQHLAISNNLAISYFDMQDYENARFWYENVETLSQEMGMKMGLVYAYNGLAELELKLDNLQSALKYCKLSFKYAKEINLKKSQLESNHNMGKIYFKMKEISKAESYYKAALSLADSIGSIRDLLRINRNLFILYKEIGSYIKAIDAQEKYILFKDSVFNMDKTELMESLEAEFQTKEAIKERKIAEKNTTISQLETEKANQAALLSEEKAKERYLWLIVSLIIFIIIVLGILVYVRQFRIKKKNQLLQIELESSQKKLQLAEERQNAELKAIKAQMNPHFLFNALNSIQEYIILNQRELASEYLGKFADLVRKYLDQSNTFFITLEDEIETLTLYIELEALRQENIAYQIEVDEDLFLDEIYVPPLLIQPYVENAFKHGLWHKKTDKKLKIEFLSDDENLICIINDNGIGRKASAEITSGKHQSFATNANEKRLHLIRDRFGDSVGVEIEDIIIENKICGTKVTVKIPLDLKKEFSNL